MVKDIFPKTESTWIVERIRQGADGMPELRRHLMQVYAAPLRVYYLAVSSSKSADPDEVINGFFSDRLSKDGFLLGWQRHGSRLRRWLQNALLFYLKEQSRRDRVRSTQSDHDWEEEPDHSPLMISAEREFAIQLVRQALAVTQEQCEAKDLRTHWACFHSYYVCDRTCEALSREHGCSPERVWVMVRTCARRFKNTIRDFLIQDGVPAEEVDSEIQILLSQATG